MAAITFSYRSKIDKAPLETRLSFTNSKGERTSIYSRSKIEVSKDFWTEYKKKINFRDSEKHNKAIELDSNINELKDFVLSNFEKVEDLEIDKGWLKSTIQEFYNPVKKKEEIPSNLLEYYNYYLDLKEHQLKESVRSWQKWVTVRNKLKNMIDSNGKSYLLKDVNEQFAKDWSTYCKKLNYANTTTNKEFSYIKTICTHAKTKGKEVSLELDKLKLNLKESPSPKVYLSFDELKQIEDLKELPDNLENSRDWLLISCYTGQRVSDFMRFNKGMLRTDGIKTFLDVKQVKTNKVVSIPILPVVIEILNKRDGDFPKSISAQKYNDYIKKVGKLAGLNEIVEGGVRNNNRVKVDSYPKWKLITSHIGRRSLATNFYGKIPTTYLKNITGHGTEQMLLAYIGKTSKDTASDSYDLMMKTIK